MNELSINRKRFGRVRLGNLSLEEGVGCYRAQFRLVVTPNGTENWRLQWRNVRGKLILGHDGKHKGKYIGEARPDRHTISIRGGSEGGFDVYVPLSQHRLQKLQAKVSGDDVQMTLYLSGQYSFKGESPLDRDLPQPAEAQCSFEIPESNWVKEITRCGFASILLFELELPDADAPDDLQDAVTNLREAKSDIDSGKYSDAVYRSRKALESCHKALDEETEIDRAKSEYKGEIDGEGRNDMSLTKRELLAGDVARHFMNQAPHPDETGQHVPHNRRQATLALRLAEAFLSSAIGRYRDSK